MTRPRRSMSSSTEGQLLSMNFIVMLILSMVIFTVGLVIFLNMYHGLDNSAGMLEERMRRELDEMIGRNGIGISSESVERDGFVTFFFGFTNNLDNAETFYIHMNCDLVVRDKTVICDDDANACDAYDRFAIPNPIGPFTAGMDERVTKDISFSIPKDAAKGTYTYYVRVCTDDPCTEQYMTPQAITITIS